MKRLLWLLMAATVLLLGLPAVIGILAEHEVREQLELAEGNAVVTLKISDYDRGWFTSRITYEFGLRDDYIDLLERESKGQNQDSNGDPINRDSSTRENLNWREIAAPIEILSQVTHGPAGLHDGLFVGLFRATTKTGPDNPRLNDFLNATGMPHLFLAKSTTGLTGDTKLALDVPSINADANQLPADSRVRSVEFSGMNIRANYSAAAERVVSEGGAENLSVVADDLSITMRGLRVDGDSTLKIKGLPMGSGTMVIDEMTLFDATANPAERVELLEFRLNADTTPGATGDTANIAISYKLAEARMGDDALTDLELSMRMNDISIEAAQAYTRWSNEFVALDPEDPQAFQEMLSRITPVAHQFIRSSPSIAIDPMKFTASDEPFVMNFNIRADASKLPAIDNFDPVNIPMWMSLLSGDAGASISESLANTLAVSSARSQIVESLGDQEGITEGQIDAMAAQQAPMLVEALIQQGMVNRTEGKLAAKVAYKDGDLLLNGQPMPLGALLGGM